MGWQRDLMAWKVLLYMFYGWFSLSFVWLCVAVWERRTSDVGTAMEFGQLVAASISLIILFTKD